MFFRRPNWKLNEMELEALADPAARMIHGRKKIQAAIQRGTDPALVVAALLAILEARVFGSPAIGGPTTAPPGRASAPRAAQQPPQQTPAPAPTSASGSSTAAAAPAGSAGSPRAAGDLSSIDASVVRAATANMIDDLQSTLRA